MDIRYPEIIQNTLETILRRQACVDQESLFALPLVQSAVVKHFEIVADDERNDIVLQAFLEHNQSAYAPIAILKGMDVLKADMEADDILKYAFRTKTKR